MTQHEKTLIAFIAMAVIVAVIYGLALYAWAVTR
jgi:hypothetical protein